MVKDIICSSTMWRNKISYDTYRPQVGEIKEIDEAIIYNFDLYETMKMAITELLNEYKYIYINKFSRK